jgi:hypothetical protein
VRKQAQRKQTDRAPLPERLRAKQEARRTRRIEKELATAAELHHRRKKDAEKNRAPAAGGGGMG